MTRIYAPIIILIIATLLFIAPAVAEDVGQTDVTATVSEVVIHADTWVSLVGYTVNGQPNLEKITVLSGDTVVISVNGIPPGMALKTVAVVNGEEKELHGNPITLSGFPRDVPTSIPVYLSFAFLSQPNSGGSGSSGTIPTYTPEPTEEAPTETQTPGVEPTNPTEPEEKRSCGIPLIGIAALGIFLILILALRRVVYRILRDSAKQSGFETERAHLKEIAKAIIKLLRDSEAYPEWRKNPGVEARLRGDIIRLLDEMQYPPVPREEVSAEILKAGKGVLSRYRL